jgi:hypothetical protein
MSLGVTRVLQWPLSTTQGQLGTIQTHFARIAHQPLKICFDIWKKNGFFHFLAQKLKKIDQKCITFFVFFNSPTFVDRSKKY